VWARGVMGACYCVLHPVSIYLGGGGRVGQGCDGRTLVRSPPSLHLFGGRRPCGPGV
jgi:hypothetical protein